MHLLIALATWSSYCARRHRHLIRLTSGQLTELTSTLSATASGYEYSSVCIRSRWIMLAKWSYIIASIIIIGLLVLANWTQATSDWDLVWRIQQTVVDKAIDEWRRRLRACVHAEERHFEHLYVFCWHAEWLNLSRLLLFLVPVNAGVPVSWHTV